MKFGSIAFITCEQKLYLPEEIFSPKILQRIIIMNIIFYIFEKFFKKLLYFIFKYKSY